MNDGFCLLRHGALASTMRQRMIGSLDLPMSDAGRAQIRRLAVEWLPTVRQNLAAIVTSDLQRCLDTANLLLQACPVPIPLHREPDLREISLGAWEGLSRTEIAHRWPGAYILRGLDMAAFVPPDGESFRMLQRRALLALAHWRRRYPLGLVLVITHAGVIRTLLSHWMALPLGDALRIPLDYACHCCLPGQGWPLNLLPMEVCAHDT
ncbi:MAG: histidine phosphatase family protein [Desulfovibrio sp.]|nr:histidine phosphatase family protein [Desulfovibrio sp.]